MTAPLAPLALSTRSLIKCIIGGKEETVLFDTGSQVSIVPREWKQYNFPEMPLNRVPDKLEVMSLSDKTIPFDGWFELSVDMMQNDCGNKIYVPFLVCNTPIQEIVLGTNAIKTVIDNHNSLSKLYGINLIKTVLYYV